MKIAFRRLRQHLDTEASSARGQRGTATVATLLCTLLLTVGDISPAMADNHSATDTVAETSTQTKSERQAVYDAMQEVLAGDEFHQKTTQRFPKFLRDWLDSLKFDKQSDSSSVPDWLKALFKWLASSIEIIIWVATISLLLLLIYKYRRWAGAVCSAARERGSPQHRQKPYSVWMYARKTCQTNPTY